MAGRVAKVVSGIVATSAVVYGSNVYLRTRHNAAERWPEPVQPSGAKWHDNWDRRSVESCVKPPKENSDLEKYEQKLREAHPKATRHIILVRHGQYHSVKGDPPLSALGKEQAEYCAKRLKNLEIPIDTIYYSTMARATETGLIISKHFEGVPTQADPILEEGTPPAVPSPSPTWRDPEPWEHFVDGQRMEAAFRKYIHRASAKQENTSYEILACHGLVIAYFTLRALQLPPEAWSRLQAYNSSITWISVYPSGDVALKCFGDVGHLPADKVSDGLFSIIDK